MRADALQGGRDLDLAVVGNCTWAALVDRLGRVVWACFPRFDSDPIFPALLNGGLPPGGAAQAEGLYAVELEGLAQSEQHYDSNTAILVTILRDHSGAALEIRDFAPRFVNHGRVYRPTMLVRRLRPLHGNPRIRIVLRPRFGYGQEHPSTTRGSNHIRFVGGDTTLRLTTDAPVSHIAGGAPFLLQRPLTLVLGPDESFASAIGATARDFEERTRDYWIEWSRTLAIPFEWQQAVIRAAISLKLCSFEETGAVVAALTTSIPEAAHSGRNWDYRYCWLRDAYFVIHALGRLGATRTMEGYLEYLATLVSGANGGLQPVYGIGLERDLAERRAEALAGYRGMGPVRVGNQAFEHTQNDVYGSVVLAATQAFFDHRLLHPGGERLFALLEEVGRRALESWDQPDAGLWELRTRSQVHTFSALMCWAACDRLARIATRLGAAERAAHWQAAAARLHGQIARRSWCRQRGAFAATFGGADMDASLLLMNHLGFLPADDARFAGTLRAIEGELRRGDYLLRYAAADDFGAPENAFNVCTFWFIDALADSGRREEARALFENMLARRNHAGLLSEDLDPASGELWGNFPQTYSMVGLINSALRLSRSWEKAF